jgi:hypothetical protein
MLQYTGINFKDYLSAKLYFQWPQKFPGTRIRIHDKLNLPRYDDSKLCSIDYLHAKNLT